MLVRVLVGAVVLVLLGAAILPWTPARGLIQNDESSSPPSTTVPVRRPIATPTPSSSDIVLQLTQCLAAAEARRYDTGGLRAALAALPDRAETEQELLLGLQLILQTCNTVIGR